MYSVAVKQDFIARHFLFGGDWGAENQKHSHHYQIEVLVEGNNLDEHGYLVDIDRIKTELNLVISHFRDRVLNELFEFKDMNPSIEHLARIIHQELFAHIPTQGIYSSSIKVWEDASAWAAYREER
jgi:6-pyruvoyltetrahydropterin/6-carboxytetrahydropterin synthase